MSKTTNRYSRQVRERAGKGGFVRASAKLFAGVATACRIMLESAGFSKVPTVNSAW